MKSSNATDIRSRPAYTAADAARYLRLPVSTVRAWAFGQGTKGHDGSRRFQPVIAAADPEGRFLSFLNLVEMLVLAAIRRRHTVSLPNVRKAVEFLRKRFPSAHPLADHQFQPDGMDLFVEQFGQILNLSRDGQIEMRQLIQAYLKMVDRDARGVPVRLHLPRAASAGHEPAASRIVIDPRFGFGRPVVEGSGVRADVIVERFSSGERIADIAPDYAIPQAVIYEAIHLHEAKAA